MDSPTAATVFLLTGLFIYAWAIKGIPSRKDVNQGPKSSFGLVQADGFCKDSKPYGVDIIFVHGLGSNPDTTWSTPNNPAKPTSRASWVTESLPSTLKEFSEDVRVYFYNYDSYWKRDAVQTRLRTLGEALGQEICTIRETDKTRAIVFVAHCYGGLVVKQMLKWAKESSDDIVESTRAVIFLGTPHRGTTFGWLGSLAAWALSPLISNQRILREIDRESSDLLDLHEDFQKAIRKDLSVLNFYEQRPTRHLKIWFFQIETFIVKEQSAKLAERKHVENIPLGVDHYGLNKFRGGDENYKKFSGKLLKIINKIKSPSDDVPTLLREYYFVCNRIQIGRLSGEFLPMDQCYINLTIIEHEHELKFPQKPPTDTTPSPYSRPKLEASSMGQAISLSSLFDERKRGNSTVMPKRIFIQGRAGVGKTTLCKKIVHDAFEKGMWKDLFDWIIWIPLRRLKTQFTDPGYMNLGDILYYEYFRRHPNGSDLAKSLWKVLSEPINSRRTLFVLDGMDEVSRELGSETHVSGLLHDLLDWPQVIVTSRPLSMSRHEKFDLELETVGFDSEQVDEYITKVMINSAGEAQVQTVKKIQSFIQSRPVIQGLVRIPILLDALCFTWSDRPENEDQEMSMTMLYHEIVLKLWKKDMLRLGKKDGDGEPPTMESVETLRELWQIEGYMENEARVIECLAFSGLYHNIIEFNNKFRDKVYRGFQSINISDKTLSKLSFLRSSDTSLQDTKKTYHFLHLTFQEYFAAKYFARCWKSKACLEVHSLEQTTPMESQPEEFIHQEKYNKRYDIFWRFVSGLLYIEERDELALFFQELKNEPRDLLGPADQRLLMHCFNEIPRSDSEPRLSDLRKKMECQCEQWSHFEYKLLDQLYLCRETEFPTRVLSKIIAEKSVKLQVILHALGSQGHIPLNLADNFIPLLHDEDEYVRESTAHVLGKQAKLSEDMLFQHLIPLLNDKNRRRSAIDVLGKQAKLSEDILFQYLIPLLNDKNRFVRRSTINALQMQTELSENLLFQHLIPLLNGEDKHLRKSIVDILGKQTKLSEDILFQHLIPLLNDKDESVRRSAIGVLGKQTKLPKDILFQHLIPLLNDEDGYVRESIVDILGKQTKLSEDMLFQHLIPLLNDEDGYVRESIVDILGKQTKLSEDMLFQHLIPLLNDEDGYVRESTIHVLEKQINLSKGVLFQYLIPLLNDENIFVRRSTINILGKQTKLSEDMLFQHLIPLLNDEDGYIRRSTINILEKQTKLSEDILFQHLIPLLNDEDKYVRESTIGVLEKQTKLPKDILFQHLIPLLNDEDEYVRRSTINILGKQAKLSEDILFQHLIPLLNDKDGLVRQSTIDVILETNDYINTIITGENTTALQHLYESLLKEGIEGQLSCYMRDSRLHIEIPQKRIKISLPDENRLLEVFHTKAREMASPSCAYEGCIRSSK